MFNQKYYKQLLLSYLNYDDREYTEEDYLDGDEEYATLSMIRFYFPDDESVDALFQS